MWIETPDGLVNLAKMDTVFLSQVGDKCFLVARKNTTDTRFAEFVLCFGSKTYCNDMLGFIADCLRADANVVTVRNGDPKPEPETDYVDGVDIARFCGDPETYLDYVDGLEFPPRRPSMFE